MIAAMMFEIILAAGYLKGPEPLCWFVQHNLIWGPIFSLHRTAAYRIVQFKLRRLLYDEICNLGRFPNFKSSRILGFCLAVLGLVVGKRGQYDHEEYALRRVVVAWAKKHFLSLHDVQPYVAETCLLGAISFDPEGARLVRTWPRNLDLEQHKDYLELDPVDRALIRRRGENAGA
jgi:hypothetical protein